jgi:hypothetical protein
MDPEELRERAYQYRKMAARNTDARAVKALNDLADEYEARAAQVQTRSEGENEDDG